MAKAPEYERIIAKAIDVYLGYEDHGMFIVTVTMDYGTSVQGFQCILSDKHALDVLQGVMGAFNVREWSAIEGRTIYVLKEEGYNSYIRGFEPLPTEGGTRWTTDELDRVEA